VNDRERNQNAMPDVPKLDLVGTLSEMWSGVSYAGYHLAYFHRSGWPSESKNRQGGRPPRTDGWLKESYFGAVLPHLRPQTAAIHPDDALETHQA
jgi:hypothetical protein